jgi:hypothetical protein
VAKVKSSEMVYSFDCQTKDVISNICKYSLGKWNYYVKLISLAIHGIQKNYKYNEDVKNGK